MALPANDVCILDAQDFFRFALANFLLVKHWCGFLSSRTVLDVAVHFIALYVSHNFQLEQLSLGSTKERNIHHYPNNHSPRCKLSWLRPCGFTKGFKCELPAHIKGQKNVLRKLNLQPGQCNHEHFSFFFGLECGRLWNMGNFSLEGVPPILGKPHLFAGDIPSCRFPCWSTGFASAKCHHEPDRQDTWWLLLVSTPGWINRSYLYYLFMIIWGGTNFVPLWLIMFWGDKQLNEVSGWMCINPVEEWQYRSSLSRTIYKALLSTQQPALISGDLYRGEIFGRENWVTWWRLVKNSGEFVFRIKHAPNHSNSQACAGWWFGTFFIFPLILGC